MEENVKPAYNVVKMTVGGSRTQNFETASLAMEIEVSESANIADVHASAVVQLNKLLDSALEELKTSQKARGLIKEDPTASYKAVPIPEFFLAGFVTDASKKVLGDLNAEELKTLAAAKATEAAVKTAAEFLLSAADPAAKPAAAAAPASAGGEDGYENYPVPEKCNMRNAALGKVMKNCTAKELEFISGSMRAATEGAKAAAKWCLDHGVHA